MARYNSSMLPGIYSIFKKIIFLILCLIIVGSNIIPLLSFIKPAYAAVAKVVYRPDRHSATSAPSGMVCIQTSTAGSETTLTITFPSQFTIDGTTSNWTMDTSANNIATDAAQWASTGAGNANSADNGTKQVAFTVGDVAPSTYTCMHFTAAGTSSIGNAGVNLTGSIATNIDSARSFATAVVSSGEDQITVNATVPPLFTFSLGAFTAALNTLSTASVTSAAPVTATVSTNALLGWSMWVKNSSNGLYSSSATVAIPAPGAYGSTYDISGGTNGYGLDVNAGSGNPTINWSYDGPGDANYVGVLQSNFKPIATKATAGANDSVSLHFRAKVSATQQAAADYQDTVTVSAAGNF